LISLWEIDNAVSTASNDNLTTSLTSSLSKSVINEVTEIDQMIKTQISIAVIFSRIFSDSFRATTFRTQDLLINLIWTIQLISLINLHNKLKSCQLLISHYCWLKKTTAELLSQASQIRTLLAIQTIDDHFKDLKRLISSWWLKKTSNRKV